MTKTPESAVGRTITAKLKELGKPRQWLADKAGVSNAAVTHWVKTGQISRDSALAVALALQISVDELYGQAEGNKPISSFNLEWLDTREQQLLTHFRECTAVGKEMIEITARGAPKDDAISSLRKSAA